MIEVFASMLIAIDLIALIISMDGDPMIPGSPVYDGYAGLVMVNIVYLFIEILRLIYWLMAHVEVHL